MSEETSTGALTPIVDERSPVEEEHCNDNEINGNQNNNNSKIEEKKNNINNHYSGRTERLRRACTTRSASRLYPYSLSTSERKPAPTKREKVEEQEPQQQQPQCSKIITPLVNTPSPSQLPRWNLRSMWELASLLNFLHVFRPLLNITIEFTAEELETALIMSSTTLDDIHIPLLKAIPPVTRMALGRGTWVTVLCRKLRDWWHWVAEGDLPIVASHGAEIEAYRDLDPATRVVILKALCDIRVEQEDIRNYIDDNIKRGIQLSVFRKERIGGDSQGTSYWYEDDPVIGYRLYREIRKVEVKKAKGKGMPSLPTVSCQWETVATHFDEFVDVSEKLFSSKNRTEAAVGKKLKNDMLPEIEKIHKRKERLLKKQQREALLLDSFVGADGLTSGRSLRDRKPVTYTFDDYDRSINEAIKITKQRQPSPDPVVRREPVVKPEPSIVPSTNGRWNGASHAPQHFSPDLVSHDSSDYEESDEEHKSGHLDRSNRRRQRPQRYSEKEFVEAISDNEAGFDSDDDIVGEAIYDEEYLRSRKQRKVSSSSEGDEEYHWDEENVEEEEEEDESPSSTDSDEPNRSKKFTSLSSTRRGTKLRSVDELQSGLRRSKRATRNRINYRQIEMSESEADSVKREKLNASEGQSDASNSEQYSNGSHSSEHNEEQEVKDDEQVEENQDMNVDNPPVEDYKNPSPAFEEKQSPVQAPEEGVGKRRFLDLNELAPGTGFDDTRDDTDNF